MVRARERRRAFGSEEPLHAARGDLAEREVLELRPHSEPEIVAIVLLGAIRQITQFQILEPEICEIPEGAAEVQQATGPKPGPVEETRLQADSSRRFGASSTGDAAQAPVGVADARECHVGGAAPGDADGPVGADQGAWPSAVHAAPPAWRCSSACSMRLTHASISLLQNLNWVPTRNPCGPRPLLRRS